MNDKKEKPLVGKVGRLRYKVWKNVDDQGKESYTLDIYRSYKVVPKDGADNGWRESRQFREEDFKLILLILDEVSAYITKRKAVA